MGPRPMRKAETTLPGEVVADANEDIGKRIEALSEALAHAFVKRVNSGKIAMPFVPFAEELGLDLSVAQATLARTLFDGQAPEGEMGERLFGGLTVAPSRVQLKVALAVAGRGSGKTSRLLAGRAIHLALVAGSEKLARGEAALVAVVAPDQRQSFHALNFVKGILESRPGLAGALRYESTTDTVRIVRPDGFHVTIEARPATMGGRAVRGPSLAGVLMEEAAFFYGEGYEVSDVEIYRAARPRLLTRGQIFLGTTPWARAGLVWELFRDNFGAPKRAVVARAPTHLMRPDDETAEMVRIEREADPDNASREFDAEFLSADAERFFPDALIEKCVDDALRVRETGQVVRVTDEGDTGAVVSGERVRPGADFAFDQDASALAVFVEREGRFDLCELAEDRPRAETGHLVPSEIVGKYAKQVLRAGGRLVVADAHYRRSIEELLAKHELGMTGPPSTVPADNFLVVRALMAAGRVKIPRDPRLLKQLALIRSAHRPGGQVHIIQPRGKAAGGGHCDIVSAVVCALSGVRITSRQPSAAPSSRLEIEVKAEEKRRADLFSSRAEEQKRRESRLSRGLRRILPDRLVRQLRG